MVIWFTVLIVNNVRSEAESGALSSLLTKDYGNTSEKSTSVVYLPTDCSVKQIMLRIIIQNGNCNAFAFIQTKKAFLVAVLPQADKFFYPLILYHAADAHLYQTMITSKPLPLIYEF